MVPRIIKFCRVSLKRDRIYPERSEGSHRIGLNFCDKILRLTPQDKLCRETGHNLISIVIVALATSCTQLTIQKYSNLLDSKVGVAKKSEVIELLGQPASCRLDAVGEVCEFRTAVARNLPVAAVYLKNPTFGPDLSPYEFFDVLSLQFDGLKVLRHWSPVWLN